MSSVTYRGWSVMNLLLVGLLLVGLGASPAWAQEMKGRRDRAREMGSRHESRIRASDAAAGGQHIDSGRITGQFRSHV